MPADRYTQDGEVHPLDARALARREVERLTVQGLSVRAAFEVEWCVSAGPGDDFVPACQGPAYGMTRLVELSDYLREVLNALAAEGVSVEQIHSEYAAGQCEVSVAADDPVGAADTAVLVRETIRAVSVRRGLRVSFAPKVLADGVGNGGHVHLILWRDGTNLMTGGNGRYGLTGVGESFVGGILSRLPALLALGAPSVASYLRLIPSHWAGAFACWGRENREAALRFVTGTAGNRDAKPTSRSSASMARLTRTSPWPPCRALAVPVSPNRPGCPSRSTSTPRRWRLPTVRRAASRPCPRRWPRR